jgi:hypothetical protein
VKTTAEKIAVMQAFEDGKEIQFRNNSRPDSWIDCPNPAWNWEMTDYRVKPEPRVIWVNEYSDGLNTWHYQTREDANINIGRRARIACRKFVEVMEDGE